MHYILYMKCVGLCHNGRDYGLDANNIKHILLEIIKGQRLVYGGKLCRSSRFSYALKICKGNSKPFIEKMVIFFGQNFPPKKIFCYNLQLLQFSTKSNNIKCWTRGAFTIILSETWKWVAGCRWVMDSFQKYIYNFAEVNRYFEDIK